jgi:plasmid stabilization system protein ParE
MFKLEWTERAIQELQSALAFTAEDNPANAQLVGDRVRKTIGKLETFSLGSTAPNGTHKIYVPKNPYFVIFRRDRKDNVKICAFVHASRDWEQIDWENL